MKILLSITSTGKRLNFNEKINQLEKLGIREIALFLTAIDSTQRQKLYQLLEQSEIESIPFVHLRNDMDIAEIDYLADRFKSHIFNIHGGDAFNPFTLDLSKYGKQIYLETQLHRLDETELKRFAGICLDVSHLRDCRTFKPEIYAHHLELLGKYPCGCGHISAINYLPHYWRKGGHWHYSRHKYHWLWEFNYLKQFKKYLPPLLAMELEDDIIRQAKVKEHILKLLNY